MFPSCSCHEPLVFGHRCTGQPTGHMWPEDEQALRRRAAVVRDDIAELEQAITQFQRSYSAIARRLMERSEV